MSAPLRRVATFVAVGTAAAAVHFGVVVALVSGAGWPPLLANVAGWGVALGVSYGGHRAFTFRAQQAPLARSALRFFALSAAGFAVNEAAYAWLLHRGGMGYQAALALVLVAVAGLTYVASRHWAFIGGPP